MEDIHTSKENIKEETPKKCHLRLKKICSQIRDQMEFYFSDANLHKDRYLKKLIIQSDNGYVDLAIFAKFNKLKSLTDDMNLVAKALTTSQLLQVSEDRQKVKRKNPLIERKDVDDRTVYVECLPLKVDHEWVKRVFQSCGKVVYVSLPKYKSTGDFKGFGFVEYETVGDAKKACEVLNNPPSSAGDKVGKFPRANKQIRQLEKQLKTQDGETRDPRLAKRGRRQRTVSEGTASEDGSERAKCRKRRRTTSEGADTQPNAPCKNNGTTKPSLPKCLKLDRNSDVKTALSGVQDLGQLDSRPSHSNEQLDQNTVSRKRKMSDSDSEVSSETNVEQESDGVSGSKKVRISEEVEAKSPEDKKSKRRRKRKKKKEVTKLEVPELRVIPKYKWMELKNEYLQLQKACMNQLKKTLRDDKSQPSSDSMAKHDITDVGEIQPQKGRQIEYVAGVIVKVSRNGEMLTRKDVKEHASKLAAVAYVDVKDGDTEGYIRCQSAEDANTLNTSGNETYNYSPLQDEAEKEYWDKIQRDREQKLNSKSKPHPQRGRDKKLRKAEKILLVHQRKHVIFDED